MIGKIWTNASIQAWEVRKHGRRLGNSGLHRKDRKGSLNVIYDKNPGLGNVAKGLHYLHIPWTLLRVPLELTQ